MLVVQFLFWYSYVNFTCYRGAFERSSTGPELLPSGVYREQAQDFPTEGHFDDPGKNTAVDMSVPFLFSPDALQKFNGEKKVRNGPPKMAKKHRRFGPTTAALTKVRKNRKRSERLFAKTAERMHASKVKSTLIAQKERELSVVSKETENNVAIMAAFKCSVTKNSEINPLSIDHRERERQRDKE